MTKLHIDYSTVVYFFICSYNFILFDGDFQTTYDISHSNYVSVEYAFRAFYRTIEVTTYGTDIASLAPSSC